jgi:putative transposase
MNRFFTASSIYNLAWNGGHLNAVSPKNNSRTCPCCGHISNRKITEPPKLYFSVWNAVLKKIPVSSPRSNIRAGDARLASEVSGATMLPAAGTY